MKKTFKVVARTGIHSNVASLLVDTASRFQADVKLIYRGKKVDAKSILGVMSLGVQPGSTFDLEVVGIDAQDLMMSLETVLADSISKVEA